MAGGIQTTKVVIVVAAIISSLSLPAYSQGMKKGSHAAPTTETRQPVDEYCVLNAAAVELPNQRAADKSRASGHQGSFAAGIGHPIERDGVPPISGRDAALKDAATASFTSVTLCGQAATLALAR